MIRVRSRAMVRIGCRFKCTHCSPLMSVLMRVRVRVRVRVI